MANELLNRKDVPQGETWDLSLIYKTEEAMLADVNRMKELTQQIISKYKGNLNTAQNINSCLDQLQEIYRLMTLTGNYCDLSVSVDYYNNHNQDRNNRINNMITEVSSQLSFVNSELMEQSPELLEEAIKSSTSNCHYLMNIKREIPHKLSPETEAALAALTQTLFAPYTIYNQTKLADMDFDSFQVNGKEYPLGYSLYEDNYEYENDTQVRREAFRHFSEKLAQYQNTTAATYQAQVQEEKTIATLRGFDSVFDALLFPQCVTRDLYNRQIDLITEKLAPHMQKYAKLIQRIHHLDKMTFPDLKIAVDPEYDPTVTIEESRQYLEGGLSILGDDYLAMVKQAYQERWVDFAKNKGKSTGGFCASPYGKNSFILLSWNDRMSDVLTLAHELGHAGHFRLCNGHQSIFDTDVSSYFVEAPSTMNELLMAQYLLKQKPDDKRFRRWVLTSQITCTYYHNFVTHLMEAAYQREVYKIIDQGGSVQADTLNQIMKDTLQKFWGPEVEIDDNAALTWMRQPHYYMGLYSYTYSAGLTVATEVARRIEREGQPAIDDWKKVLTAGSTGTPVELAQMAGVDITTDKPLLDTIAYIGSIIDEICDLTEALGE